MNIGQRNVFITSTPTDETARESKQFHLNLNQYISRYIIHKYGKKGALKTDPVYFTETNPAN